VGDYDVVDTAGMAVGGPAWMMGGRIAAVGEARDAADLPGGLASPTAFLQHGRAPSPQCLDLIWGQLQYCEVVLAEGVRTKASLERRWPAAAFPHSCAAADTAMLLLLLLLLT
jgi:hypothetical protein